jgi:hypothetical protein
MERRRFVATAALVPLTASAWLAGRAETAASGSPLKVLTTHVANPMGDAMPQEGRWRLVRVTDRAFDPLAVALVDEAGVRRGYLPPARAGVLSALLDAGATGFTSASRAAPGKVDVFLTG